MAGETFRVTLHLTVPRIAFAMAYPVYSAYYAICQVSVDMMWCRLSAPISCVCVVSVHCLFTVICNGITARSFWELSGQIITISVPVWRLMSSIIQILRLVTVIVIPLLTKLLFRIGTMAVPRVPLVLLLKLVVA